MGTIHATSADDPESGEQASVRIEGSDTWYPALVPMAPSSTAQVRRSESSAVPPQWLPMLSAASPPLRPTIKVALLGVVLAAYDQCDRPVALWAGVNQVRRPYERLKCRALS